MTSKIPAAIRRCAHYAKPQIRMKGRNYGTGSYPLPPHGLHLSMRHTASTRPLIGPCFLSACMAYSEHVGVNLHEGGVNGEMHR